MPPASVCLGQPHGRHIRRIRVSAQQLARSPSLLLAVLFWLHLHSLPSCTYRVGCGGCGGGGSVPDASGRQRLAAATSANVCSDLSNIPSPSRSKDSFNSSIYRLGPQPLGAQAPNVRAEGAVVEGEFVNGRSVKDWVVKRSLYQALHMAMAEELARDPRVCIIGEDVGHYGGSYKATKDFHFRHGNFRVLDTPICENTFTGMGIGAAMHGLRPIVEGMNMGFLLLAFNQIANNAGMVRATSGGSFDVPMVIRGPGGIGKQLGPEHSQRIEAYLMAIPGLKLVACSTPRNARGLLKSAIREDNPVVFFEHVLTYGLKEEIPLLPYTQALDKAEVALEGTDITILAYSKLRHVALDAAKALAKMGIRPEIVDLICLKPLDLATIKQSIRKTGNCLILDESSRTGGVGGEVFAQVVENCSEDLKQPPVRLATKDIPTPYSKALEEAVIVNAEDIINAALWMLSASSCK